MQPSEIPTYLALDYVEPGRHVVLIGISGTPSTIDSRTLILKGIKLTGILSASPGLKGAIELLGKGAIDPRPLIAHVIPLEGKRYVERQSNRNFGGWTKNPYCHEDTYFVAYSLTNFSNERRSRWKRKAADCDVTQSLFRRRRWSCAVIPNLPAAAQFMWKQVRNRFSKRKKLSLVEDSI
jgi:hypothetical protein